MDKLFGAFKPVTAEGWLDKLSRDLKGNTAVLLSHPELGIDMPANLNNFQADDASVSRNLLKMRGWKTGAKFDAISKNNNTILSALNGGVDCLSLRFINQKEFDAATKDVMFEHIESSLSFSDPKSLLKFQGNENIRLRFDPISEILETGESRNFIEYRDLLNSTNKRVVLYVNGQIYGNSGSSTIQELAFSLAHLNEYLQELQNDATDISLVSDKIEISLAGGSNYLLSIAKYRAIRELVSMVLSGYGVGFREESIRVIGATGSMFITNNDHNNNLLRQTSQCMSAILGGCDEVIVVPYDEADESSCRMARNIQLILREESYFDKVSDPAGGAYIIEHLTDQLVQKAWSEFLEIEKSGGLLSQIKTGTIQKKVSDNLKVSLAKFKSGESTLIGVNKFRNPSEQLIHTENKGSTSGKDFEKLVSVRIENLLNENVSERKS